MPEQFFTKHRLMFSIHIHEYMILVVCLHRKTVSVVISKCFWIICCQKSGYAHPTLYVHCLTLYISYVPMPHNARIVFAHAVRHVHTFLTVCALSAHVLRYKLCSVSCSIFVWTVGTPATYCNAQTPHIACAVCAQVSHCAYAHAPHYTEHHVHIPRTLRPVCAPARHCIYKIHTSHVLRAVYAHVSYVQYVSMPYTESTVCAHATHYLYNKHTRHTLC